MSLRNRITFFLISLSLLAVLATGLLVLENAIQDKKNYATELNSVLAPQIANSLDQKLRTLRGELTTLHTFFQQSSLPAAKISSEITGFKSRNEGVDAVFIFARHKLLSFALRIDLATPDKFKVEAETLEKLDTSVLNSTQVTHLKDDLFLVGLGQGQFAGVLINKNFFLESFDLSRGKSSILVSEDKAVLFQTNAAEPIKNLIDSLTEKHLKQTELFSLEVLNDKKEKFLLNFSRLRFLNGSVVFVSPQPTWKDLTAPIIRSSFGLVLFLIVLSVLIAYWISKSLAEPIERLSQITSEIGRGDWKIISIRSRSPEISKLTKAFNRMINNLKNREEELRIAQNKVIQANSLAAVGRMSAGIAHEVKNPLASISGYAQLVEVKIAAAKDASSYQELITKIRDYTRLILDDTRRANKIISDLLTFSRQKEVNTEKISAKNLIQKYEPNLKSLCEAHGTGFEARINIADHISVKADSDQIYQVFLNLVQNALHALKSAAVSSPKIELLCALENGFVEIKIIDNGPGISDENMKKIFEPFFSTKKVGEGSGLGLALCYGIIQQHQGHIDVVSKPNTETCFRIRLPVIE